MARLHHLDPAERDAVVRTLQDELSASADVSFADLFGSFVGEPSFRDVDAPVPFLFKVLRGQLLACRDERHLADIIERTARGYHDIAPLLRRATREAFAA